MGALQFVDVPGYSALILRKTYADLNLSGAIMDRARQWLAPFTESGEVAWKDKEKRFVFPSGATISFGYLESANDRYRYAGAEYSSVFFDELNQFPQRDYEYLFTRLRKTKGVNVPLRMRSATNPGGPYGDWVKARFVTNPDPSMRIFIPATVNDNPGVDPEEYAKSLRYTDPVERARMLYGDWDVQPENLIYPEIKDCVVPEDKWPKEIIGNRFGGIDWGFNDPQVFISGILDQSGTLWIDYERYVRFKTLPEHLEALPPEAKDTVWFADPSQPSFIEEMRRNDFVVRRGKNAILEGIKVVKAWLRMGRVKIHPRCKAMVQEMGLYRRKNDKEISAGFIGDHDGPPADMPLGKNDHCADCTRYLIASLNSIVGSAGATEDFVVVPDNDTSQKKTQERYGKRYGVSKNADDVEVAKPPWWEDESFHGW